MTLGGGGLLEALKQAHEALLIRLDALATLTDRENPDRAELSKVRYNLSRASGVRRRMLEEQVYPALLPRLSGASADAVRKLQEQGTASVSTSSEHINRWTIETALADWSGYRAASAHMRASMRTRIDEEQRVLYPLLRSLV